MNHTLTYVALAAVTAGAMLSVACSNEICTENQNSIPRAEFVNADLDTQLTPDTIAIMGVGAPNDSLLYEAGTSLGDIYLPLRPNYETTSFLFHYTSRDVTDPDTGETTEDHSGDDILIFSYTTTPYFDGADCGAMYRYYITDLRYTTHGIDKIYISDPVITNIDQVRIFIVLKTPPTSDDSDNSDDSENADDSESSEDSESFEDSENSENSEGTVTAMRHALMGVKVKGGVK